MNVIIPEKRKDGFTSFVKLVSYISARDDKHQPEDEVTASPSVAPSQANQAVFDRLVNYIERAADTAHQASVTEEFPDGRQRLFMGSVPCETNCFSLETAAAEMNLVARGNTRCKDPVYHFILSWQEHESPTNAQIFESAGHCLEKLGLEGHQYVTAIHQDTDNVHCHVAVNRVHPTTFKAKNMWKDAEKLQKACRVLERKYGFAEDNGSWVWSEHDTLIPAPFRFPGAPQGAAKTQIYSDTESLFHYSVRTVRDQLDAIIGRNEGQWVHVHHALHERGLGLREQGGGLVIYDAQNPEAVPVKASSIHPSLTKARLEPHFGVFTKPPEFTSVDPLEGRYGVFETYLPTLHLRDQDARMERRLARAAARQDLEARYEAYRLAWQKPDLNVQSRAQAIKLRCQSMKASVRRLNSDPLTRKLMYRVAEFEQLKAMAELRLTLRGERAALAEQGLLRPLRYRAWVEREAQQGDTAAVSQLRGWAYREKRKIRAQEKHAEGIIIAAAADDSPVFDVAGHSSRLLKDGTIEYLRYGQVGVIDRGDTIIIKDGFDTDDSHANRSLAVAIMGTKSGERAELVGDAQAVDLVLEAGVRHALHTGVDPLPLTDPMQQQRYVYLGSTVGGWPLQEEPEQSQRDHGDAPSHDDDALFTGEQPRL